MKNVKQMLNMLLAIVLLAAVSTQITGCKDDDAPPALTLSTLTAGSSDLNGATSPSDVAVDAEIIATFSTDIDAATATDANIFLTREYDASVVSTTKVVSGKTITITPNSDLFAGDQYTLTFSSGLKSKGGKPLTGLERSFSTPGIGIGTAPQASSQVLYLQFSNGVIDITGNATVASEKVAYTTDRFGNANGAADFRGATTAGTGDIVELSGTKLISPSMTISLWTKMSTTDFPQGTSRPMFGYNIFYGYQLEVGNNLDYMVYVSRHKVNPDPMSHFTAGDNLDPNGDGSVNGEVTFDYSGSIRDKVNNKWVNIVLTFDATTSLKTFYIDGVKIMEKDLDLITDEYIMKDLQLGTQLDGTGEVRTGLGTKLALGWWVDKTFTTESWALYSGATNTFKGQLDDFRMWNKSLTAAEVTALYNSEKP
jgi:hypothetical protein